VIIEAEMARDTVEGHTMLDLGIITIMAINTMVEDTIREGTMMAIRDTTTDTILTEGEINDRVNIMDVIGETGIRIVTRITDSHF